MACSGSRSSCSSTSSEPPNRRRAANADLADVLVAGRVGLAFAALAVIPASTALVVGQPGLGVFVLPVVLVLDALVVQLGSTRIGPGAGDGPERVEQREATVARVGIACVLGLVGGVVVAQWGSASLPVIVHLQATGSVFGVAGWGLPTAWAQPGAFLAAVVGVFLVGLAPRGSAVVGGPRQARS